MKEKTVVLATTVVMFAIAVVCLGWWLVSSGEPAVVKRVPSAQSRTIADAQETGGEAVNIEGRFLAFDGQPSTEVEAWPRFRGDNSDNVCSDGAELLEQWPSGGPPLLWSIDLGEGYAGAAVNAGRVYVLDYDETETADSLRCFSLSDGSEIWRRWYNVRVRRNHGMSRTVPAVTDEYVVTIGPKCHVMCVDAQSGAFLWGIDLVRDFGTTTPLWYTGQCPLIDGSIAVIAPGGSSLMIGIDCRTGDILWRTPNPDGWQMSHASIIPAMLEGRRTYVYCAIGGIVGVSADEETAGTVLWKTAEWNHTVAAPSAVVIGDNRIFVTAGYGAGSGMFEITEESGVLRLDLVFSLTRKEFACEQHTPVYYKGHLFTVMPKDGGEMKQQFACMRPDGRVVWSSGRENRFGLGPFLVADDKVFILDDDGVLTMIEASSSGYVELARARVLDGPDAWGPMAIVGGKLLARDLKRMICLDLSLD